MANIKTDYSDAPQLVQDFLSYKVINQGKSERTCHQYYHDLRTFFRYVLVTKHKNKYGEYQMEDLSFNEVTDNIVLKITAKDVNDFIMYCTREKKNGIDAIKRKQSALRSFYKYLQKTVMKIEKNPLEYIESPKKPKRLPKFLSLDESLSLLDVINGPNAERDYAIITLFLNCGLRVSELVGISLKDIDRNLETLRVIGKGNKERMLYLNDACKEALMAYLAVRPKNPRPESKNALFISRNRNRISDKTVQWLVYKYLKDANLDRPGMSVHKLRHTAATLMYQHGKTDVRILKEILGHENLATTEIYTHVSDAQMKNASNQNPLSGIHPPKRRGRPQKTIEEENDVESQEFNAVETDDIVTEE